nr:immunoglobulin heavy chain junction region [Mus musculus]MBK4189404.1 immunoglobulin heavy chain junction region [Mus musculus]
CARTPPLYYGSSYGVFAYW